MQLLGLVAAQLRVSPGVWDIYAQRDQTRREHLQEILARLGLNQFDRITPRDTEKWLLPIALQTTQGLVLAEAAIESFADVALSCRRFWSSSESARKSPHGPSVKFIKSGSHYGTPQEREYYVR